MRQNTQTLKPNQAVVSPKKIPAREKIFFINVYRMLNSIGVVNNVFIKK